jgi:hypothetical protein
MPYCIRKLETIQGIYYGFTLYNEYFRAGVIDDLPSDYTVVTHESWNICNNVDFKRMLVLQGKKPSDFYDWYWIREDVVKQMAIMWGSYKHISKTTAKLLQRLLGVNEKSHMMPELLVCVAENKENLKDHPMELDLCLALAMAAHPTLGSASEISVLFYAGVMADVVPGFHFNSKFKWSKRPAPAPQDDRSKRPAPAPQDDRARREYDFFIREGLTF